MELKELKKKLAAFKRKRERVLIKRIAKRKLLIARKINIEKQKIELVKQQKELQELRKKTTTSSYSGAILRSLAKQSTGAFKGFRQFATEYTKGQQPKRKKKRSMFDF